MNALMFLALWQETGDMRSMSWWLPKSGEAREVVWWTVLTLNLLVLLWFLGKALFGGKNWSIPKMVRGRGVTIREQMEQAAAAQQSAEARLRQIEARIANLPSEVAAMEQEAHAEAEKEHQRLVAEARQEAERIAELGKREIEAAAKLAQKELKGLAAALAVDLAQQRIREQLTPEQDAAVVSGALSGMRIPGGGRPN
ncbi:MAG TPA: ATP synthase F0 subunit B [Terriglobales bacterium]|nr:ATP synthase F0 subunit B [Terriglobales bacterium]